MLNQAEQDLEQIELSIEGAKQLIEFAAAIDRLRNNPDFKKVIINDYMEQNAIRLVKLKAAPGMQNEVNQKFVIGQLDAIGHLDQYFACMLAKGYSAKVALEQDEATREDILAEAL